MRFPATILLLLLTGCADGTRDTAPMQSQVGQNCIVYFRRDALGMAADIPSSIVAGDINGADVTQPGELMAVGNDWIVINLHGRAFHIPQATILMVEFGNNITQTPGLSKPVQPAPADHTNHNAH